MIQEHIKKAYENGKALYTKDGGSWVEVRVHHKGAFGWVLQRTDTNTLLSKPRTAEQLYSHIPAKDDLLAIVNKLEPDAVLALVVLGERLLKGQARYGKLDIANDNRAWHIEREEELQDALIYGAFKSLKGRAE